MIKISACCFSAGLLLALSNSFNAANAAELSLGNLSLFNTDGQLQNLNFVVNGELMAENVGYKGFADSLSLAPGWNSVQITPADEAAGEVLASTQFFLPEDDSEITVLAIGGVEDRPLRLLTAAPPTADCGEIECINVVNASPAADQIAVEQRCASANGNSSSVLISSRGYADTNGFGTSTNTGSLCEIAGTATDPNISWKTTLFDQATGPGITRFFIIGDNKLAPPEIIGVYEQQLMAATEVVPDPIAGIASSSLWRDIDEPGAAFFLQEDPLTQRITGTVQIFDAEGNATWRFVDGIVSPGTGPVRLTQLNVSRAAGGQVSTSPVTDLTLNFQGCNQATVTLVDGTLTTRRIERTQPVDSCLVSQ